MLICIISELYILPTLDATISVIPNDCSTLAGNAGGLSLASYNSVKRLSTTEAE